MLTTIMVRLSATLAVTIGTRTSLLHTSHRWPDAIHLSLWPSAMKNYVNLRNNIPSTFIKGGKIGRKHLPDTFSNSPLSKISGIEVKPNLAHYHLFGSPVYVLQAELRSYQSHKKWSDRTRVGIFVCHSPDHSSNVTLILNTTTANIRYLHYYNHVPFELNGDASTAGYVYYVCSISVYRCRRDVNIIV